MVQRVTHESVQLQEYIALNLFGRKNSFFDDRSFGLGNWSFEDDTFRIWRIPFSQKFHFSTLSAPHKNL